MYQDEKSIDSPPIKVTTMTSVTPFNGEVDVDVLFYLLRTSSPSEGKFGSIYRLKYDMASRGEPNYTGFFKNAIDIRAQGPNKVINLKLSRTNIQMVGKQGVEIVRDLSLLVLEQINTITGLLSRMKHEGIDIETHIGFCRRLCRGETLPVLSYYAHDKSIRTICQRQIKDNVYEEIPSNTELIKNGLVPEMIHLLLFPLTDKLIYKEYIYFLEIMRRAFQKDLFNRISILDTNKSMVNYNYALGFAINRRALSCLIQDEPGFTCCYDNRVHTHATIFLYFEDCDATIKFLVYKMGRVTETGPSESLNNRGLKAFIKFIHANMELIKSETLSPVLVEEGKTLSVFTPQGGITKKFEHFFARVDW